MIKFPPTEKPASINADEPEHADVWEISGGQETHVKSAARKTENSGGKPGLIPGQGTARWHVTHLVHLDSIQE